MSGAQEVRPPAKWRHYQFHWLDCERSSRPSIGVWQCEAWYLAGEEGSVSPEELHQRGWRWYCPAVWPMGRKDGLPWCQSRDPQAGNYQAVIDDLAQRDPMMEWDALLDPVEPMPPAITAHKSRGRDWAGAEEISRRLGDPPAGFAEVRALRLPPGARIVEG